VSDVVPCCYYCENRSFCGDACPNEVIHCQFCAWMLDDECKMFDLDYAAYRKVEKYIEGVIGK